MALVPLSIPPGVYRNGTEYQQSNRWREANLVRWEDSSLRPIGGWRSRVDDAITGIARGMLAWEDNSSDRWIAAGTANNLYVIKASNDVTDITPAGLTAGNVSAEQNLGFGGGFYGTSYYGTIRPNNGVFTEATTWSLDNWGEYLVACNPEDGVLYEWDLDTVEGSDLVTNGGFDADSDWVKGSADWTISGGTASFSGSTIATLDQTLTFVNGETYEVTFTITGAGANEARVLIRTSTDIYNETYGAGTHTFRFRADATSGDIEFEPATATAISFDVDDVSVKKIGAAAPIANAPVDNLALMVTEERFLFALGAGGNPRKVQWSDREDNTTWSPDATNEAGSLTLQTQGQLMAGIRIQGRALLLTDSDAHAATYIGPPYVYGIERVGSNCGLISRKAIAAVDSLVFWMGKNGFFAFDGSTVAELQCDVTDYVFDNLNQAQISKIYAMSNNTHDEVWWFYPDKESSENIRYVAFNYKGQYWMTGDLGRSAGVDSGVFPYPMAFDDNGDLFEHEVGLNVGGATIFAETGPLSLGAGDQVMIASKLIPDEKTQGDTIAKFKTRFHPNDVEREYGPFTMSNPTSVRFTGRQVRMRVEGDRLAAWRVGTMRLDVAPRGRR